jgi:hypothetical protein
VHFKRLLLQNWSFATASTLREFVKFRRKPMKCNNLADVVYDGLDGGMPFMERLTAFIHILFCRRCAAGFNRLNNVRNMLKMDYLPLSPDFEDAVMARIYAEEAFEKDPVEIPGGVSTRGWVIAGCVIVVSLATVFFGKDFAIVANSHGSSFLLPLGIITGIVVTGYGSLFIGSHIKELSERFHLR